MMNMNEINAIVSASIQKFTSAPIKFRCRVEGFEDGLGEPTVLCTTRRCTGEVFGGDVDPKDILFEELSSHGRYACVDVAVIHQGKHMVVAFEINLTNNGMSLDIRFGNNYLNWRVDDPTIRQAMQRLWVREAMTCLEPK